MNLRGPSSRPAKRPRQTPLPPGATRSAGSSNSRHPLPSLAAVMSSAERRNMPLLHPKMLNGGLWFGIHDCIRKSIVVGWQANFWGPWWNYGMVPSDRKESWWTSFVQKYYLALEHHDAVLYHWETILKNSIRNTLSKRRRDRKKPAYIGESDWALMEELWEQEHNKKLSETNSGNRRSDPDELGLPCHTSGSKGHVKIAHEMTLENGGVPPAATELVRRTHTKKDGTFIDKRAEVRVHDAEELASNRLEEQNANSSNGSTVTRPTPQQLTDAYIEIATNDKGQVYGLGSAQYADVEPNEAAAASLRRRLDVDARLTYVEDKLSGLKDDVSHQRLAIDVLLRINGINPITLQPLSPNEDVSSAPSPLSHSAHDPTQLR